MSEDARARILSVALQVNRNINLKLMHKLCHIVVAFKANFVKLIKGFDET